MADSTNLPTYAKFLFASLSGMGAAVVCFPLELLKTRMQVRGAGRKIASITTYQLLKQIIKTKGIGNLYTGLSASVLRQATYTGTRVGAFQVFVDYFTENGKPASFMIKCVCSILSGAVGGAAGLPADVALTRMAADDMAPQEKRRNYTNVINAIGRISREEGFLTLFRGLYPTVIRAATGNISQLISYTQAKETLLKYGIMENGTSCHITSSVFSACINTTCVLPLDIAKIR